MIPPELESAVLAAVDATLGVMIVVAGGRGATRAYANQRAAEILGWPVEELAEKPLLEILAPEERPRIEHLLAEWQRGVDVGTTMVLTYVSRDGRRVPVETTRFDVHHEGRRYAVAFFSDISGRLRVEEALRASEEGFRRLAEASPDTITIIQDGRFIYANPAAVAALGFEDMAEFVARPLTELLEPDEMRTMVDRLARVRAGERLAPIEYRGRRKDGTFASLEISSISIELNGRPANVAFGRDVTERKALQAKLIRAEQMATLGQLAAGVAHEINNPLAYVTLNLEHVRRRLADCELDPGTAGELALLLEQAADGTHRVASIARQLLWFSRPGVEPSSTTVAEAVQAAMRLAGSSLKGCSRIDVRCDDDLVVQAEERRLTQVLLNLLLNAAEAQERGCAGGEISIHARAEGDWIVIDVSDAGEGIPEVDLERVFEPFFTTKASGTGLGLAVSRSIVESFGGSIVALRRAEAGTTMRAQLRAAPRNTHSFRPAG
jgi:two-component system NtrC family sensor kinase